mgnify:CR=1 FL=1
MPEIFWYILCGIGGLLIGGIAAIILSKQSYRRGYTDRKTEAEAAIGSAEKQAEEIRVKAQQEADEQLKGLQAERDSLTRQVSDLKAAAAAYRAQFEALLQSQQEAIEKAANLF